MSALDTLLAQLDDTGNPRLVDPAAQSTLREGCALLREEPVLGGAPVRLFSCGDRWLVEETSNQGEILLRAWPAREAAEDFIARRLDDYDRMWDG